jgi:hypothetical protein
MPRQAPQPWAYCANVRPLTRPIPLLTTFLASRDELGFEREAFCRCGRGSTRVAGDPWQDCCRRFWAMFPAVGATLGSLHPVTWAVLWTGLIFQTYTTLANKYFNNSGIFCLPSYVLTVSMLASVLRKIKQAILVLNCPRKLNSDRFRQTRKDVYLKRQIWNLNHFVNVEYKSWLP